MSKQRVIPIGKMLLVKPVEKKETYKNTNIILAPEQVQQIPRGTVLKLGPDCSKNLKTGDVVEWEMNTHTYNVTHDNQECVVLAEQSIVMKYV